MKIGHFIITLFNLRLKWVGREKNLQEIDSGTDVNYLTKAFNRFETYTVPSMVNQSVQDFIWIVLFSNDTPLEFRMKLGGGTANS